MSRKAINLADDSGVKVKSQDLALLTILLFAFTFTSNDYRSLILYDFGPGVLLNAISLIF